MYLHPLMATVPTAANAAYYAQIVVEKAILRRLVEAGTRIVQLGCGGSEGSVGGGEVDKIVDRAQAEIYDVTERRTTEDYVVLEELLQPTMDEIDAIAQQGGRAAGVPTGFADLDNLTNGLHPGQMIIVAARPGIGKSTLALDMARHAAVRHRQASVIFSLEMSKTEITMRLLSAEAGIRLSHMRAGTMGEQDWQKIVRRMTEISDAPLFIDDSHVPIICGSRARVRGASPDVRSRPMESRSFRRRRSRQDRRGSGPHVGHRGVDLRTAVVHREALHNRGAVSPRVVDGPFDPQPERCSPGRRTNRAGGDVGESHGAHRIALRDDSKPHPHRF